jgi:hypothetical protein
VLACAQAAMLSPTFRVRSFNINDISLYASASLALLKRGNPSPANPPARCHGRPPRSLQSAGVRVAGLLGTLRTLECSHG